MSKHYSIGDTIYYKTFGIEMMETIGGIIIGLHDDYIWVQSDNYKPHSIKIEDIKDKDSFDLWQSFYSIDEKIKELQEDRENIRKKIKSM